MAQAAPVEVNACGECNVVHLGMLYKPGLGFHHSTKPSDEQILERMKARRDART